MLKRLYCIKSGYCIIKKKECILYNIRMHHECVDGIENSVPRITIWHHKACRVMTNGDPKGRIFISHPHTNNGFFFLLIIDFLF